MTPAEEQTDEGRPERPVEDRVNDGVDRRADVAQPQTNHDDVVGHFAVRTGGEQNVEDEERRPAEDEREKHQSQNFGGLLLVSHRVGGHVFPLRPPGQQSETRRFFMVNSDPAGG